MGRGMGLLVLVYLMVQHLDSRNAGDRRYGRMKGVLQDIHDTLPSMAWCLGVLLDLEELFSDSHGRLTMLDRR